MSQSLKEALELIQARAREDPELAEALRTLLGGVLALLPEPVVPVAERLPEVALQEPEEPAPMLEAEQEPAYAEWPDLSRVVRNLALKTRACRWLVEHGYTQDTTALQERFALMDEARAANCYLWMFDLNRVNPNDLEGLRELAELLALTIQVFILWQEAGDTPDEREADRLLAESQAALRVAAQSLGKVSDTDQYALFQALRLSAQASRTFLPQLSLEYQPLGVAALRVQLGRLEETRRARQERERSARKLRNKARYHVGRVGKDPGDMVQWRKVEETVAELRALGEDASELVAPLKGLVLPETLPELAAALSQEVTHPPTVTTVQEAEDTPSEAVARAGVLLQGREVVIIGGEARKEAAKQLETAFGCRVRWLEAAPHTSLSVLSPAITEEVAVVLLLIRWSSHVYGELVHVCKARGVPLVRLAGGYSPNRVAHDVLVQAGERLRVAA